MATTDLITIGQDNALAIYSSKNGLDAYVAQVAEVVNSFEHDMKNVTSRKRTASLAAKVSKIKVKFDDMGKALTKEWQDKTKVVNANRKAMRDSLDELRDLARKPLTDWENEQEAIKKDKAAKALAKEIEQWHEMALLINDDYDRKKSAEQKALEEAKEAERVENEKRIAEQAIINEKAATLAAEKRAHEAEAEKLRLQAQVEANTIHYWIHQESDSCGYVVGNIQRDELLASGQAELCEQSVFEACKARNIAAQQKIEEEQRAIAAENKRKEEEQLRQEKETARQAAEAKKLAENEQHRNAIYDEIKLHIMQNYQCPDHIATQIVMDMRDWKVPYVNISYGVK